MPACKVSHQRRHSCKDQVTTGRGSNLHSQNAHTTQGQSNTSDSRGSRHTVETGHNVGLTAITSKCIWTPDKKRENKATETEGGEKK